MNYITLAALKPTIGIKVSSTDDTLLETFLQWATSQIENYKGRHYDPRIETRYFDVPSAGGSTFGVFEPRLQPLASQAPLRLDEDLLEMTTLLNGDSTPITEYVLEPANCWPKTRIRLISGAIWNTPSSGRTEQVIAVTGTWGSHSRYNAAWKLSGTTVQDNPLSSSATTITLTGVTGLEAGQLLKIESEFVLVTAVNTSSAPVVYTLTVERGANGSTAASHVKTTPFYIWQVQGNITQACARLVKWRYTQKDVDTFDKTYSGETGMVSVPTAIPTDVMTLLGAPKAQI